MKKLSNVFVSETLKGKGLGRILFNLCVADKNITGKVVDIGSKKDASYYRFMNVSNAEIITIDVDKDCNPDIILNIEKDPIPLESSSCDYLFMFNLLEHLNSYNNLLSESFRVISDNGSVLGCVPFLASIHPDPHDYVRYTKEKLEHIFKQAGFMSCEIKTMGYGPFTAAYGHIQFMLPRILKLLLFPLIYFLDRSIQKIKPSIDFTERYPIGYYFELKK
jgi:SAM-dependent methyltransferase